MPTHTIAPSPIQTPPRSFVTSASHILPSPTFRKEFNQHPFLFQHNLANHPLFSMPRLLQLALETRATRPQELYYDAGHNVPIGMRWNEMGDRPPLEEAFERIQDTGSWITIHQAQRDPRLRRNLP